jgi:predicted small secreted protein
MSERKEGAAMRVSVVLVLLLLVTWMIGCRMVKGLGRDIEHGSDTVQDKVHDVTH